MPAMPVETPSELLREAELGDSEKTPFIALGGVTIAVGLAVLAVCVIAFAAYYLS
jgi:hypothetical protein